MVRAGIKLPRTGHKWCMHAVSNIMNHGCHGLDLIPETDMCKLRQWTTGGQERKMKHGGGLHGRRNKPGSGKKESKEGRFKKESKALLLAWSLIRKRCVQQVYLGACLP